MRLLAALIVVGTTLAIPFDKVTLGRPLASQTWNASRVSDCTDISKLNEGDSCLIKWSALKPILHPTQSAIGFAWADRKLDKDYSSSTDAQDALNETPVPVCKGPSGGLWAIDCHHEMCALDASGYTSVKVTIQVVCDYSANTLDEFWDAMQKNDYVYLGVRPAGQPTSLPTPGVPSTLPSTFEYNSKKVSLVDDPFRSLAGFIRKIEKSTCPSSNKYCMRGYDRQCTSAGTAVSHFEFRWAYFFTDGYHNAALWDSASRHSSFIAVFNKLLGTGGPLSKVASEADWFAAVEVLFYQARSASALTYTVPAAFGNIAGKLPGAVKGTGPIGDEDADCDIPTCPR